MVIGIVGILYENPQIFAKPTENLQDKNPQYNTLIFGTYKKNIIIYSQFYQSYSLTAIGFKSGKKSINWVSVGILETSI